MKEFNLSDKVWSLKNWREYYREKDVKEFIRRRLEDLKDLTHNFTEQNLASKIRKFKEEAGDKLNGK